MEVILAGYSLDAELVEELKDMANGKSSRFFVSDSERREWLDNITPETISAAYARISRDPSLVTELRAQAREEVAKAKKSNEAIVFGMGHHSVAEHVQLNFDITGISRLAIEALEEARLCAYTEKSQRYITLNGDFVRPSELREREEEYEKFLNLTKKQNDLYKEAVEKLTKLHIKKATSYSMQPKLDKKARTALEGRAKEDARYILNMATEGQLGFSANARNLEYIIRKLRYHPLEEVRYLSQRLYELGSEIIPSLIVLSDEEKFEKQFGQKVSNKFFEDSKEHINTIFNYYDVDIDRYYLEDYDISIIDNTEYADETILTSLLFKVAHGCYTWNDCFQAIQNKSPGKRKRMMLDLLEDLTEYDAVYREFEHVHFTFELIVSSSAFAQWKRHRMATITKQDYSPLLNYTYPFELKSVNLMDKFKEVYKESSDLYEHLVRIGVKKEAAEYVLTNGHRRRILITANLRELYHIARLRMDKHAQWEIREQASKMIELVKEEAPIAAMLACGKDQFNNLRDRLYER